MRGVIEVEYDVVWLRRSVCVEVGTIEDKLVLAAVNAELLDLFLDFWT